MNVRILAKYIRSILTPNMMVLGGDGSGKRAVFTNRISVLIKRDLTARSHLLPCEDQEETGIYLQLGGQLSEPDHASTLISDFRLPELWETSICCLQAGTVKAAGTLTVHVGQPSPPQYFSPLPQGHSSVPPWVPAVSLSSLHC